MSCAVILVGGTWRDSHFRPLSFETPAPLLKVCDAEMIYHHIQALKHIPNLQTVFLVGNFDESKFTPFIEKVKASLDVTCKYLKETDRLGTAGGLIHFKDEILSSDWEDIVVTHHDLCSSFPMASLYQFHKSHKKVCTIMCTKTTPEESSKYGCYVTHPETNELLHHAEKPESFVNDLVSCGVYVFTREVFELLNQAGTRKKSLAEEDPSEILRQKLNKSTFGSSTHVSLENDIITSLAGTQRAYVYEIDLSSQYWFKISSSADLLPALKATLESYKKDKPEVLSKNVVTDGPKITGEVFVDPSAHVHPSSSLGPNVSIGPGVTIAAGVRIKNAILFDNVVVEENACILNSIIGWENHIGPWSRVEGSTTPEKSDSSQCNERVTVLGTGVTVEPEVFIKNSVVLPHKSINANQNRQIIL